MTQTNLRAYAVWDGPTRWFHWINFVCVVALVVLGTAILYSKELGVTDDGKILLKTTHVWFGYVFAVNLAWRIAWAFIGNRQARWSALLPFKHGFARELIAYMRGFVRGDVRPYLGHNPLARLSVSLFFVLLIVQAVTGLVIAGTDIFYPPFGYWFANWVAAPGVDPSSHAQCLLVYRLHRPGRDSGARLYIVAPGDPRSSHRCTRGGYPPLAWMGIRTSDVDNRGQSGWLS